MNQTSTTVHANPQSVSELVDRLSSIVKDIPTYSTEPDMSLEGVLQRVKENLQYNDSPAISHVYLNKKDLKILVQAVEAKQSSD